MKIAVPKERYPGEKRVAITPSVVRQLIELEFKVTVETQAGLDASFTDKDYQSAGASIAQNNDTLLADAQIILKVRPPIKNDNGLDEIASMPAGATLISFVWPAQNSELLQRLAAQKIDVLSMDSVPRISRAQKMDALSSMANVAGYRAVIEATNAFGRFFAGQITAAGRIEPAKILVIGAGVSGLSAIGTAKSLGAIVRAFDTRLEVKEQIHSLDAEFLELNFAEDADGTGGYAKTMSKEFIEAEMALFTEQAKEVDIIITTALIPGKIAPELITEAMVKSMKQGSVIVDLAAEQGGNCALTIPHEITEQYGVKIIGYCNLPSHLSAQSSQLYASNIRHLLTEICPEKKGEIILNMEDEIIRAITVVKAGVVTWIPPKVLPAPIKEDNKSEVKSIEIESIADNDKPTFSKATQDIVLALTISVLLLGLGSVAPASFMAHLSIFVLACFVGYMVIWNVAHSLHTPLMSITNAISSIVVLGALLQASSPNNSLLWLSAIAILITSINIVGGFAVTRRMLKMFSD
ncbi:NAD(P) transhydrogenase alpha subunit [uncultured Candidatus Thioglobus sp.]|nr:NAD(P) transhydrogenase alpha subunit [uncultured Candidatus Thioglobus sp.]SMM98875.1 NAD(P) transhydrogenase alpha subunit [uncultured Candidatus Thioglobus sp.]